MMIDYRFVLKVVDFMLSRPRLKEDPFVGDMVESLDELGISCDGYFAC